MINLADAHTELRSLKSRRAVVTGGTTGIGRAIAVLLASYGAKVFVCGRTSDHLEDALVRIREVGEGDGIAIDLSDPDNVLRFFSAAGDYLGGLDIAIINAAVPAAGICDMTESEVRYAVAVDFAAYVLSAHAAVGAMNGEGDIIFIGSMSAHVLGGGSTVYAGIKAGIAGVSEAMRREQGPRGVKVGLLEPGLTGTDMQYPAYPPDKQAEMIAEETMLRAEDIAVAAHFMLTQPRRSVIQQMTVVPRMKDE